MKHKLYGTLIICCFFSLGLASNAMADGKHSVKIKIKSNTSENFKIGAFNGKDGTCDYTHKTVLLKEKGQEKTLKCHGQKKNRCKLVGFMKKVRINGKKVYVETGTFDGCEESINIKDGTTLICDWNKDKERIECNTED